MPDFEKLYFHLFGVLADAVEAIETENYEEAKKLLIAAQQNAEEEYVEAE